MDVRSLAGNALVVPHLIQTVAAARRFEQAKATPTATDGQSQYRMRSALDAHPRVGRALSRMSVGGRPPIAWQVADPASSRFIDPAEIDAAVEGVRRDGFYVFRKVADPSITDAIRAFAEQAPCVPRGAGTGPQEYPRQSPAVGRYDFSEEIGLACPEVQAFVTDPATALIAQRYLGQPALMDEVAFWWTTTARAEDASINAQLFHQDRDRLSFLKFFMYVTDVTPDTGPHVYLRGSHRHIPWSLRSDGRKSDDAVQQAGLGHEITELCGPAGTIMAVDTIGLHKGKTPTGGDRLVLENEYATSLFGMDYVRPAFTPTDLTRERYLQMPWVLQRYQDAMTG